VIVCVFFSDCEQVFDGVMCWPATKAGTISVQKCATYVHKFNDKGLSMIIICFFTQWWSTIPQEYQQQEQSHPYDSNTLTFTILLIKCIIFFMID
jgi:hypothetical protein